MSLKEALLSGTDYLEVVSLGKPDGGVHEVQVRPLNSKEAAEVEALSKAGLKGPVDTQGSMKIDVEVGAFQTQQWKADVRMVRYGLSHGGETWTDEEVGKLLPRWVKELARVISVISGIDRLDVASFRGSRGGGPGTDGGAGDAVPQPDGGSGEAGAVGADSVTERGPA